MGRLELFCIKTNKKKGNIMEIEVVVIEEMKLNFEFYSVKSVKSFEAWLLANGYELEGDKIMYL